jgi:hypothetical protein
MKRFLGLFLAMSFWSGCTDLGVTPSPWDIAPLFDASIHGKEITTHVDERFRLAVKFRPDSSWSYVWSCWFSDNAVLAIENVSYQYSPSSGRPTFETFYFHATAEGSCTVQLTEYAAYTGRYVPPFDSLHFVVHVRR